MAEDKLPAGIPNGYGYSPATFHFRAKTFLYLAGIRSAHGEVGKDAVFLASEHVTVWSERPI